MIDLFSMEFEKYPNVREKVQNKEVALPVVAFEEEVIMDGKIDIDTIVSLLEKRLVNN